MNQLDEVKRGEEAKRLLENNLYNESVDKVRDGLIKAMADSPMGDDKTHNRLVIALQLLEQIQRQIKDVMITGKMAAIQMDKPLVEKIKRAVWK